MSNVNGMFLGDGGLRGYYQAHLMRKVLKDKEAPEFLIGKCSGAINAFLFSCLGSDGLCDEWDEYAEQRRSLVITKRIFSKKVSLPKLHDKLTLILKENKFRHPFLVPKIDKTTGFTDYIPYYSPSIVDIIVDNCLANNTKDQNCIDYLWSQMQYHTEEKDVDILLNEKANEFSTKFYGQTKVSFYYPRRPINNILEFSKKKFAKSKTLAENTFIGSI